MSVINRYLANHGEACTVVNREFPLDLPRSSLHDAYKIGPKLEALEHAGLLSASDATAVVHGMLEPLQGPTPPQAVRHYELTLEGRKYLRQLPSDLGRTNVLCYGQKAVDEIVKWSNPMTVGASSQTEVTYTYRIMNLAPWANRPDIQQAFPDIGVTLSGVAHTSQVAGLQLTNRGWEEPSP